MKKYDSNKYVKSYVLESTTYNDVRSAFQSKKPPKSDCGYGSSDRKTLPSRNQEVYYAKQSQQGLWATWLPHLRKVYRAMNLWTQRRLNSLLTEVGMPPKIYRGLHYTQVMEHEKPWALWGFIRTRFIEFPKCSCIIGKIWLTLTKYLVSVFFIRKAFFFKVTDFQSFFSKYNILIINPLIIMSIFVIYLRKNKNSRDV